MSSRPLLAFLLSEDAQLPSPQNFLAAWSRHWTGSESPVDVERNDTALSMSLGDDIVAVTNVPAPVPWEDLENLCRAAWHWPEATDLLEPLGSHLLVTLVAGTASPLVRTQRLTRVVTALLDSTSTVAVYWGQGPTINSTEAFIEGSRHIEEGALPLLLWTEFRLFSESEGKVSLVTSGLRALETMEIEIIDSDRHPSELIEVVDSIGAYLARNGPAIGDGETVGLSEDQKILARHVPSVWEREGPVLRLEY